MTKSKKNSIWRILGWLVSIVAIVYVVLLFPGEEPPVPDTGSKTPFSWNLDQRWGQLEKRYAAYRRIGCARLRSNLDIRMQALEKRVGLIERHPPAADDILLQQMEYQLDELTALAAVCPERLPALLKLVSRIRAAVKSASVNWPVDADMTRTRLYRMIYGGRAAIEEAMLQAPPEMVPTLVTGRTVRSATPGVVIYGQMVHSGDILVSRGGAAASAFIARGSDYPGNFSHVALVYIDDKNMTPYIIESHIERGVAVSTVHDYMEDKKLRIMLLRMRPDHPKIAADPMLPHKAAKWMYQKAVSEHIPYDFQMDCKDRTRLFCSEVAAYAYETHGIKLWTFISRISSEGIMDWLSAFGARYNETEEPSDLEYDPQLQVVAEWRDPDTLFKDHLDNAVIDALLEDANAGKRLRYDWYLLPIGRILKLYSLILNHYGKVGPIPEGMGAEPALKNLWMTRIHKAIGDRTRELADTFIKEKGYRPPYWKLVRLAKQARDEVNPWGDKSTVKGEG